MTSTSNSPARERAKKISKTELVQFRVTDGDLRIIQLAAGHDSASIATWARATLLKRASDLADAAKGSPKGRGYLPLSAEPFIEPGQAAQITARPQVSFCPDRLVVSRRSADFVIHEIRVARNAIGTQSGLIPAEPFCADLDALAKIEAELERKGVVKISLATITAIDSLGQALTFPRCTPGTDVAITVSNETDRPMRFFAVLFGAL